MVSFFFCSFRVSFSFLSSLSLLFFFLPLLSLSNFFPTSFFSTSSSSSSFSVARGVFAESPSVFSKYQELRRIAVRSNGYVVKFNATGYRHYILKAPRPYHIFILFTTEDAAVCSECSTATDSIKRIATEYFRMGESKKSASSSASGPLPVLFAMFDVFSDRSIPLLHKLQTIPTLMSLKSTSLQRQGNSVVFRKEDEFSLAVGMMQGGGLSDIAGRTLNWVNMKTRRSVMLKVSSSEQIRNLAMILGIAMIVGIVLWLGVVLVRRFPSLVIMGALVMQFIGTSGLFYSIQHGLQLMGYDRQTGRRMIISTISRNQFLGEGLLMALSVIMCALCLVLMVYVPYIKFFKKRYALRQILVFALLLCFVSLFKFVFYVYSLKASWYEPSFMPPEDYVQGSVRLDRGNVL